jgi:hypothetical protein
MTTFAELQTAVDDLTKRPELATIRDSAIRMAILRAHHVAFFARDHASQLLTWTLDSTENWHDFPLIFNTVLRLRTPDFLQAEGLLAPYTPTENLEYVETFKDFWNEWNELKTSVFTLMGSTLRIRFAVATGRARLFFYQNPDLSGDGFSSWIADLHKEEVAKWAAGIVWARSGFLEMAKSAQDDVRDFKELLFASYMSGKI